MSTEEMYGRTIKWFKREFSKYIAIYILRESKSILNVLGNATLHAYLKISSRWFQWEYFKFFLPDVFPRLQRFLRHPSSELVSNIMRAHCHENLFSFGKEACLRGKPTCGPREEYVRLRSQSFKKLSPFFSILCILSCSSSNCIRDTILCRRHASEAL